MKCSPHATTIASNRESSKDQAAHGRLLFNTTVRSKSDGDPSEVLTLCLHFLVGTRPACTLAHYQVLCLHHCEYLKMYSCCVGRDQQNLYMLLKLAISTKA